MSHNKSISWLLMLNSSPLSHDSFVKNPSCEQIHICMYVYMFVCVCIYIYTHAHIYMCVCVLIVSVACVKNQSLPGGMLMTCMAQLSFCFECRTYMCVLYMVFWSDCVFEFFLALFLAEFNPQLSSLANLWNKSELICVTHSLR